MKLKTDYDGLVIIDIQTKQEGNSAAKVGEDETTLIMSGGLHDEVTLYDLNIRVIMNPGSFDFYKDMPKAVSWEEKIEVARTKAFEVIGEHLQDVLVAIINANRERGRKEGIRENQADMREALGL